MRSFICLGLVAFTITLRVSAQTDSTGQIALDTTQIAKPELSDPLPHIDKDHVEDGVEAEADTTFGKARTTVREHLSDAKDAGGRSLHKPFHTEGNMEVGGVMGPLPYSTAGAHDINVFGKGDIGFGLAGVPVRMLFDMGTDVPLRGQRNSVRFTLDRDKLVHGTQVIDAVSLSEQKALVDSLQQARAARYRDWRGAEFRITELRAMLPSDTLHTLPATPDLPSFQLPDSAGAVPSPSVLDVQGRLDSLQRAAESSHTEMQRLEGMIADAEREQQKMEALFNSNKGAQGRLTGLLSGIEHLDVGSCSPSSSEFLVNGITFQGVSFAYAQHDVYVSLDRGRSFDDSWMATDRTRSQLESLQRSLFFSDSKDLAPRRITAIRAGFGAPERSHFHIGYLYGEREDVPAGYSGPPLSFGTERNHVVEADLGYEVRPGHMVRGVVARSLTLPGSPSGDEGSGNVGDLFRRGNDQNVAAKVTWSSRFERSGMTVDLEGRSIAPYFRSMGLGFVRNGSKAAEVRLARSIGRKWKLRGRYMLEGRAPPGMEQDHMTLHRAQLQANFRASRTVTLRTMCMPLFTRTVQGGAAPIDGRNTSVSIGGDINKRWEGLTATLTGDVGRYDWTSGIGVNGSAMNWTIGATAQFRDRLQARVLWNKLVNTGDSLVPGVGNSSVWLRYTIEKWEAEGSVQAPTDAHWGWTLGAQRSITKRLRASARASTYSRSELIFQDPYVIDPRQAYTWSCSLIYSW